MSATSLLTIPGAIALKRAAFEQVLFIYLLLRWVHLQGLVLVTVWFTSQCIDSMRFHMNIVVTRNLMPTLSIAKVCWCDDFRASFNTTRFRHHECKDGIIFRYIQRRTVCFTGLVQIVNMAEGQLQVSSVLLPYLDEFTINDIPAKVERNRKRIENVLSPIEDWVMKLQSLLVGEKPLKTAVLIVMVNIGFWWV